MDQRKTRLPKYHHQDGRRTSAATEEQAAQIVQNTIRQHSWLWNVEIIDIEPPYEWDEEEDD